MATIGLDSLYYSKVTVNSYGEETYSKPVKLAKAIEANVSVELNEAILYADDGTDVIIKEFKSGTISLNINDIGAEVARDLTGAVIDANGVIVSASEDKPQPVAIGFRAKNAKGKYRYFWLYHVVFGIPATTLKTKGESIEFQTPTIEGIISRRVKPDSDGKHPWKVEVTEGDSGVTWSTPQDWFNGVYEPKYKEINTYLKSLSLSNATLSPAFYKETYVYSATATGTASTITATADSNSAAVAITVNGTSIVSGGSVTWKTGNSKVKIVVSDGTTYTRQYFIDVVK